MLLSFHRNLNFCFWIIIAPPNSNLSSPNCQPLILEFCPVMINKCRLNNFIPSVFNSRQDSLSLAPNAVFVIALGSRSLSYILEESLAFLDTLSALLWALGHFSWQGCPWNPSDLLPWDSWPVNIRLKSYIW